MIPKQCQPQIKNKNWYSKKYTQLDLNEIVHKKNVTKLF